MIKLNVVIADGAFYKSLPELLKIYLPENIIFRNYLNICPSCKKHFKSLKSNCCSICIGGLCFQGSACYTQRKYNV